VFLAIKYLILSCYLLPFCSFIHICDYAYEYTGCFKKSSTTLKAYRNLYRGHTQRFELSTDQEGRIHFQQDGAPPHYLGEVREYLNTRFPGRWIGRAAPRSAALPMEVTLNHNYSR